SGFCLRRAFRSERLDSLWFLLSIFAVELRKLDGATLASLRASLKATPALKACAVARRPADVPGGTRGVEHDAVASNVRRDQNRGAGVSRLGRRGRCSR